jgi:CHRD domain
VNRRRLQLVLAIGVLSLLGVVGAAVATSGRDIDEQLTGYEETPQTLSTPASGEFKARVSRSSGEVHWRLSYRGFETRVTQAHIHFGARALSGGIGVWLCDSPSNVSPTPVEQCPTPSGTLSGTFDEDDVVGPTGQGISAGEFEEFVDAMRAGFTYANVHSEARPAGEIRAQLEDDEDRD